MKRILFGAITVALGGAVGAVAVPAATASTSAPRTVAISQVVGGVDGSVGSAALSSWQTDGIVFALAYGNGVVYAGGQFGNARPPGQPAGSTTGEVTRTFLAAFNSTTGALITSFDPTITETGTASRPGVYALALSPDGKTLYAGGTFNKVDGTARTNLAAFDTSTGALTSWRPAAYSKVDAIAVSPDGSQIYFGGQFSHVNGVARTYAASADASGKLLPWAPALNAPVYSLAVPSDDSQVVIGGGFQSINGVSQNSAGAVDPTTGTTNVPWTANIVPWNPGTCTSSVKNIVISGGTAYLANEGNGGGCFDGDFAVSLGSTDSLLWQSDCLGATQAVEVVNGFLYKGSHAHDCAYAPGGFPQVSKPTGGWVTWHLLDQSLTDGTLGHWTPSTNVGATERGVGTLGPHAMATDGSQLFVGGDFTTVNNKPQQGFAIFPAGLGSVRPSNPTTAPTVTSTSAGIDSISFPAVSSQAAGTLSYKIYRDGASTAIATLTATSWPWAKPVLHYLDTGLTPGSSHTYTYMVADGVHSTSKSPASAPVTVSSTSPSLNYQQTVLQDNPSFLWPLSETSGSTANDASPNGFSGSYESGTTQGVSGPFSGQTATGFDGSAGLVTSANQVSGPQTFSVEGWFKTTTNDGGKLIGFGNNQTGSSSNYDRHIYMMNDGQLVFGIWNNQTVTIETPNVYNDGAWHYVVATYGPSGTMTFYVDGQLIGTNSTGSSQGYSGYWRVGGDNLNGWNLDPWGSNSQGTTQPHSYYFNGSMADVAVYPTALSASQVAAHYAAALQQGVGQ
ncbi:MAG TPA: LamG domain-containing protein [Streptosporangiaceae bacterium]|nr:LamG domain-containing protein [Streptosporangiaceae bacterium]